MPRAKDPIKSRLKKITALLRNTKKAHSEPIRDWKRLKSLSSALRAASENLEEVIINNQLEETAWKQLSFEDQK